MTDFLFLSLNRFFCWMYSLTTPVSINSSRGLVVSLPIHDRNSISSFEPQPTYVFLFDFFLFSDIFASLGWTFTSTGNGCSAPSLTLNEFLSAL
ncbi:Os01g0884600 [Oryza sativa Japonica Group]|uniref:Os01g0884600 protein n=1 Tax=Oryza sativa subsp. japonica TaxID=39947 RepID=A0A0P0VBD3_ORYSJ|nr:hypothetical protein EE612_007222 [Oryza sativa]BAS75590.1 Os01g0884600 [Oryza sativa Japonica Group]